MSGASSCLRDRAWVIDSYDDRMFVRQRLINSEQLSPSPGRTNRLHTSHAMAQWNSIHLGLGLRIDLFSPRHGSSPTTNRADRSERTYPKEALSNLCHEISVAVLNEFAGQPVG